MKIITPFFNTAGNCRAAVIMLAVSLLLATAATAQTRRYVKPETAGTGDGSSWENASPDLQLMINGAVKGDTIWVAGGTYKPNRRANALTAITPNDRDNAFVLKDSVLIYGGFAGTEVTLSERDLSILQNTSILSGDFNGDDAFEYSGDTLNIVNNAENAYHVVVSVAQDPDPINNYTRLDGFTITGGNANDAALTSITVDGYNIFRYAGGGIINRNSSAPTMQNLVVTGNYAIYGGGAYNRYMSNVAYIDVLFDKNVGQFGGGVTNWNTCSPIFTNVVISNNRADAGGGVYNLNNSNPGFTGVEIINNFASLASGGGVFSNNSSPVFNTTLIEGNHATISGGGLYCTTNAMAVITNSDITQNTAPTGGGIFASGTSNLGLSNVEISGNEATEGNGGGYYNYNSAPQLNAVNITNNSATGFGGGMANWDGAVATVSGGEFNGNTASAGAGVFNFNESNGVFTHVTFTGNQAEGNGGGAYNRQNTNPVYTNCLFTANTASYGAGMYNLNNAVPVLTNLTIAGNVAAEQGGGLTSDGSSPIVRNTIIYGNEASGEFNIDVFNFNGASPVFSYSLLSGSEQDWPALGTDGGNNVFEDPDFVDAAAGDYAILYESPAQNMGSNTYFEAGLTPDLSGVITDLAGNPRFFEDGTIDIGAYEVQQFLALPGMQHIGASAYPNPVIDVLTISTKEPVTAVRAYNMLGQEVNVVWNSTTATLNMAGLQAGNYVVKVTAGNASAGLLVVKQ
jgi:hypothetical protein